MRRLATVSVVMTSLLVIGVVSVAKSAPAWTHANGLDFWNLGHDEDRLRREIDEGQNWDNAREQLQRRRELTQHITHRLCEGSISLDEAVDSISTLAQAYPRWFEAVQISYRETGVILPTATDRDVLTRYLLTAIKGMLLHAEGLNDTSRSAFLSARLARLTAEGQFHAKQTSASTAAH